MVQLRSQRSDSDSDADEIASSSVAASRDGPPKSDASYDRKILLCKEGTIKQSLAAKLLPHPRSKAPSLYYGVGSENTLCEIVKIGEGKRSFFYGETVVADGDIVAFTPINPVFFVLPYLLENAYEKYVPLDQLIPETMVDLLANRTLQKGIKKVSDWKDICDTLVYRYNKDKMLAWLKSKYGKIQEHIIADKLVSELVMNDEDAFKRVSFQLLNEYLPDVIADLAKKHFEIKELEIASNTNKRSAEVNDMQEFATTIQGPPKKQPAKISTAQKQLKQASKGTKSLKSFFSPKPAAK